MRNDLAESVFTVDDLLTPAESREWIRRTEEVGYDSAPVTTAMGPVMMSNVRNNDRVMIDSVSDAEALFDRLLPHMPEHWQQLQLRDERFTCVGLNERLRFYRYSPGEFFAVHRDGSYRRDNGERSLLTLLVYLNEPEEGGATNLWAGGGEIHVRPKAGLALLFAHRLLHEGEVLTAGSKYVLRTDVMYEARPA